MKRIVCEMCGSSNVVKQGEVYVCQDCGTQYDKDSARALMVEVPEEPVKTSKVTVDNSEEIKNLFIRSYNFAIFQTRSAQLLFCEDLDF